MNNERWTKLCVSDDEWQALRTYANRVDTVVKSWEGRAVSELQAGIELQANEEEYALGGKLIYHGLKEMGYPFLPGPAYLERVKQVFGIDLDNPSHLSHRKIKQRKAYIAYIPYMPEPDPYADLRSEFCEEEQNFYFFRPLGILILQPHVRVDLERITDKDHVYLDTLLIEENYHWNNYLLNEDRESLAWLTENGMGNFPFSYRTDLGFLVEHFGYDTESIINKEPLDYMIEFGTVDKALVFANKDIENKLRIGKNVLRTIAECTNESTDAYYKLLEDYLSILGGDDTENPYHVELREMFTPRERRTIIAYCLNTLQPLHKTYFRRDNHPVPDVLLKIAAIDRELVKEIKENEYYGLPNLADLIGSMPQGR